MDAGAEVSQVVVTASRADSLGAAFAASQGRITKEELELRPAMRVGQVLEAVPGLAVTIHSGEGKANQFFARGFNLDHGTDIAVFIDDIPVNRPTNAHGQGYSDLNFILPNTLEGIDYAKGTYRAETGDFGDVAAVRLRLADRLPDEVQATLGSLGVAELYASGGAAVAGGQGAAALDISHSDGPWRPGDDFRKYAALARYVTGGDRDGAALTAMYYKGDGRFSTDQPARAHGEGLIGRYGLLDPTDGNSSERLSLSGRLARPAGDWSLRASAYAVRSRQTLWNDFTHFLEDPVNGDQEQQDESRWLIGGAAAASRKDQLAGATFATTFGFQWRRDDIYVDRRHSRSREVLAYCERLNPDGVTAAPIDVGLPFCTADHARLTDLGAYVQVEALWTSWLRTSAGLREEHYTARDRNLTPGGAFSAVPFSKTQDLLQPKLNLALGPFFATEVYASAGRGFHSDDARGVSGAVPLEGLGGVRAAPLLAKADGAEVGVRSNLIPKLFVDVSAFNVRLASEIVYDQDQGEDQPGPTSDRYGVEMSARYQPRPWLELNADLAVSHARFIQTSPADLANNFGQPGSRIPLAPTYIGSLGALVKGDGPWFGALQVRALGPYALVSDNSFKDNGYTEINVRVGYAFSPRASLEVEVFNLFNTKANATAFHYTTDIHDGRGPVSDYQVHPLEPTSLRVVAKAAF